VLTGLLRKELPISGVHEERDAIFTKEFVINSIKTQITAVILPIVIFSFKVLQISSQDLLNIGIGRVLRKRKSLVLESRISAKVEEIRPVLEHIVIGRLLEVLRLVDLLVEVR